MTIINQTPQENQLPKEMQIFHHRNWYQLLESPKRDAFPGRDTVYRFLNHANFPDVAF